MKIDFSNSPAKQGFHFPAEWAPHIATWLSWPHKEESWPGKIDTIYPRYCEFVKVLTEGELVRINAGGEQLQAFAQSRGHSMLELAFSWLASRPQVSSVIAGATRVEQVEQNVKAIGWALSAEELAEIDRITVG